MKKNKNYTYKIDHYALKEFLESLPTPEDRLKFIGKLPATTRDEVIASPIIWLSKAQMIPKGDWFLCLILGGRGLGKSHVGGAWIAQKIYEGAKSLMVVGPTYNETFNNQVQSILKFFPKNSPLKPVYTQNNKRIDFANGAVIYVDSTETELRGQTIEYLWLDEICKFKDSNPEAIKYAWEILVPGLREGENPQCLVTTTPKPFPIIKDWVEDAKDPASKTIIMHGTILDNPGISQSVKDRFLKRIAEGDRLARQELLGEIVYDVDNALFKHEWIRRIQVEKDENENITNFPLLKRIVIGIDPAVSVSATADNTGIIVVGELHTGGEYVVLEDASGKYTPFQWAAKTSYLYEKYGANCVVIEKNNGGDLVTANLKSVNNTMNVIPVHATVGKTTRAEPVSGLYERGKVFHFGLHKKLEDEMVIFTSGMAKSPDRVDALVWCLTHFIGKKNHQRSFDNMPAF